MHAFDVLGDPVRRQLLELLAADDELSAGDLTAAVQERFGISQPAVSQHLRVLREHGFVVHRPEGARRIYRLQGGGEGLREADEWLAAFRRAWEPRLDALATEISRGKRARTTTTRRRNP